MPLIVVAIVAVALVAVACPLLRQLFMSPLDDITFTSSTYLPLVSKGRREPDSRFGIAEHTPSQAALLGLADADYSSGQWRLPLEGDTAVFFTITERDHWSTWKLCSWSPVDGWYDEQGCREWLRKHPGMIAIVGNELAVDSPIGLGDLIDADGYSQWYHEAWNLIKTENPTALVAPYGPVGQVTAGLLLTVWDAYLSRFGTPLPTDFYSVHHYCIPGETVEWCWTKLTHWISWLESYRGTHWSGPRDYWPTEWGLPAWSEPAPEAMVVMERMIPLLRNNDIGISRHAWWPSCNSGWPEACTLLVKQGQVTELGVKYLELALE